MRAQYKQDLARGEASLVDVLWEVPRDFRSMRIDSLLLALPRVGQTKMTRILKDHRISPSRSLQSLSDRQRVELLSSLAAYGGMR